MKKAVKLLALFAIITLLIVSMAACTCVGPNAQIVATDAPVAAGTMTICWTSLAAGEALNVTVASGVISWSSLTNGTISYTAGTYTLTSVAAGAVCATATATTATANGVFGVIAALGSAATITYTGSSTGSATVPASTGSTGWWSLSAGAGGGECAICYVDVSMGNMPIVVLGSNFDPNDYVHLTICVNDTVLLENIDVNDCGAFMVNVVITPAMVGEVSIKAWVDDGDGVFDSGDERWACWPLSVTN